MATRDIERSRRKVRYASGTMMPESDWGPSDSFQPWTTPQSSMSDRRASRRARAEAIERKARGVAGDTRDLVEDFPMTAVLITAAIAGFIGYQIGKP